MRQCNVVLGIFLLLPIGCSLASPYKPTQKDADELMKVIHVINHNTLAYQAAVMKKMLGEANYFVARLQLPTVKPIQMNDVIDSRVPPPWFAVIMAKKNPSFPATPFGLDICNPNIPLEQRLCAIKIGVRGQIETTNFFFGFNKGRLWTVERLSEHNVEYYANDLGKLVGQHSLIDTNGAYQLATQWLAAVDMDMPAVAKLKWTVHQLHYKARGATNYITLPLYYVDFGSKHYHFAAGSPMKSFNEPQISVEILGTTKQLQEMDIKDASLSRRPQMLISNALELIRTSNPPLKHLQPSQAIQTNMTPRDK